MLYGTIPEYLWKDSPDSAILRADNGKWYALFMNVEGCKLGVDSNDKKDIMVVKCEPDMINMMILKNYLMKRAIMHGRKKLTFWGQEVV